MERILDLLYDDMAMSLLAIQFGIVGVLAAVAGLFWHQLTSAHRGPQELQPVPAAGAEAGSGQPSG